MREELNKVRGKITFVCDTDLHGISLCATAVDTVHKLGVPASEIAVIAHFATGSEISSTGRGNLEGLLSELLSHAQPKKLFLLDVPAKSQRFVELVAEATKMFPVTVVDDVSHWRQYIPYLWTLDFNPNNLRLQLSTSTTDGYLHFMLIRPSRKAYEMAALGVVSENKFEELPKLDALRAMVPQEEGELPLLNLDFVRRNYGVFVAVDSLVKFGKAFAANLPITLVGNSAAKVAYFVETPLESIIERALKEFPVPSDAELEYDAKEFAAILKREAPRGQAFKYASLLASKVDTPFVVTVSEGFEQGKKIIVVAPNSFIDDGTAASIIRSTAKKLHETLVEKGFSTPSDYPRGDAAVSIGVFGEKLQDAVRLIVEELNAEYVRQRVDVYAARIAEDVVKLVVLEERVASSFGIAVKESVNAIMRFIDERIRSIVREELSNALRTKCN